jgi:MiaB-like tRNA modifying enzyme
MKFYIETYGCTANHGNSQELEAALAERGHEISSCEEAHLVIVNTCAVTDRTERKVLKRLRQLQGDRLIVAGCLPSALPKAVEGISCRLVVGVLTRKVTGTIADSFPNGAKAALELPLGNPCGIVNISEGCAGDCTYCLVKRARGRLVSRDEEDIVGMVRNLVCSGVIEIQMASQDAAAYGMDTGSSLDQLLHQVARLPGSFRVRVGMMNPKTVEPILSDLVRAFKSRKIYKFLHLPLQSGSNKVLKEMRRGYTAEEFVEIYALFRKEFPGLSLTTDVIVGFPGEGEEEFAETRRIIQLTQPDKVNITRYSRRPNTPAYDLYDMPDRIKKDRSRDLTELWKEIVARRNRRYIGKLVDVLVTERGRGDSMKARTENYTDVVVKRDATLGAAHIVKITGSTPFYLIGEVYPHKRPHILQT